MARMALTCEAVAGRGLGWFENWAAGMRVTVVPLMAGLVRTSTISCVTGWNAREGLWLVLAGQPGDLVLHGLLAGRIGSLDNDLKALVVLEQAGIEFGLYGAGGRGAGEAGQTDFLRDAGMEFQHGLGPVGWIVWLKKRRAWVQRGLGTSTTLHARHLLGSRETGRSAAGHAARAACFFTLAAAFSLALASRRACCARV